MLPRQSFPVRARVVPCGTVDREPIRLDHHPLGAHPCHADGVAGLGVLQGVRDRLPLGAVDLADEFVG
jgi:hypothetical protein